MIRDNILKIRERIVRVCAKNNQDPNTITVVAVSKGRTAEQIKEAIESGVTDIGENRVQEALLKYNALRTTHYAQRIRWHMVGHLQTNKAKEAVRIFDLIHSLDSLRLTSEINKQAAGINKVQDILIQVNTSCEPTKFGLKPEEVLGLIEKMKEFKNINIKGLMTIAPLADDIEKVRPYFRSLRQLRDKIFQLSLPSGRQELSILSMGMTDDFEVAIEEDSNMIRLGRAIFSRQ